MKIKILSKLLGTSLIALLSFSHSEAAFSQLNRKSTAQINRKSTAQTLKKMPLKKRLARRYLVKPNLEIKSSLLSRKLRIHALQNKSEHNLKSRTAFTKVLKYEKSVNILSPKQKRMVKADLNDIKSSPLLKHKNLVHVQNKIQGKPNFSALRLNKKIHSIRNRHNISAIQKNIATTNNHSKINESHTTRSIQQQIVPSDQIKATQSHTLNMNQETLNKNNSVFQAQKIMQPTRIVENQFTAQASSSIIQAPKVVQPAQSIKNHFSPPIPNLDNQAYITRQVLEAQSRRAQLAQSVTEAQHALSQARRRLEEARAISAQRPGLETQRNRLQAEQATAQTELQAANVALNNIQNQLNQLGNLNIDRPDLPALQQNIADKERQAEEARSAVDNFKNNHWHDELTDKIDEYKRLIDIALNQIRDYENSFNVWNDPARPNFLNGLIPENLDNYLNLRTRIIAENQQLQEAINNLNNPARPHYNNALTQERALQYLNLRNYINDAESDLNLALDEISELFRKYNINTEEQKQILSHYHALLTTVDFKKDLLLEAYNQCQATCYAENEGVRYSKPDITNEKLNEFRELVQNLMDYSTTDQKHEIKQRLNIVSQEIFKEGQGLDFFNEALKKLINAFSDLDLARLDCDNYNKFHNYEEDLSDNYHYLTQQAKYIRTEELPRLKRQFEDYMRSVMDQGITEESIAEYCRLAEIINMKEQDVTYIGQQLNYSRDLFAQHGVTEEMALANEPLFQDIKLKYEHIENTKNIINDHQRPLAIPTFIFYHRASLETFKNDYDHYKQLEKDESDTKIALQDARQAHENAMRHVLPQNRDPLENARTQALNRKNTAQEKVQQIVNNLTLTMNQLATIPVLDPALEVACQTANQKHITAIQALATVDQEIQAATLRGARHTASRQYEER